MQVVFLHIAAIVAITAIYLLMVHFKETREIRRKEKNYADWLKKQPKAEPLKRVKHKLLTVAILILSSSMALNAQTGLLVGMGVSYGGGVTGDLIAGVKANRLTVAYNQVAFISADKPAYFGGVAGYDVIHSDEYKLTILAGPYYRKQTSDADGKDAGNYATWGAGVNLNKGWFSITARYIDNRVHVGIMASGLLTW